jgi:anaerobic magnesium-protoporphyrin IX monomethyl ester cyclase
MTMKIALVSLLGNEHISIDQRNVFNSTEPLGLLYIGGVAKEQGHNVELFHSYQQANPTEEEIVENILDFQPDVLGISSMTNTFDRSMDLAEKIKTNLSHMKIIVGGDHIGTNPSDIENYPIIDVGVYGEGEETFRQLLGHYENRNLKLEDIDGISFIQNGKVRITNPRERIVNRTKLPLPLRDSEIISASKVGALMYPSPSEQTGAASLLFQFGCPLGCTYCSATTLYGSNLTSSSPEFVVEEMKQLKNQFGINTAFFTDLTFNLRPQLSEELCAQLAEANLGISWYALVRPTSPKNQPILKDSTLEAMVAGGCSKIGFGIESFAESAMKDYHRPTSLQEDERVLRTIDRLGALSKVFLILGHPDETVDYYNQIIESLKWLKPDEVRISFLTPFPGTSLWNSLDNHSSDILLSTNYDQYTTFNPIMRMKHFLPEELEMQKLRILREYYSSSEYEQHSKEKIVENPQFERSFTEFHDLLFSKWIM